MAWIPLESNPEVMTKFLHKLGVPKKWSITDVYGLDSDLLEIIPQPVLAVILLHPIVKNDKTEEEKGDKDNKDDVPDSVYYMKQCVSNACGTIALIHSVANNLEMLQLEDGHLKKFLDETKDLSPTERGERLVNTQDITDTHKESAQEGQTEAPGEDVEVYYHFIAFIHKNGSLYELDGRKTNVIKHGSTAPETLLQDAARVCKEYIARNPDEVRFTVIALAANE